MTKDVQSEDDDEESFRFGDFTFASTAPNVRGDDDDWSDFVGFGDGGERAAVGTVKGVDPTWNGVAVDGKLADSPVRWIKPGGAIPLSIFGEEESDEVEVEEGSRWDDPRVVDGKDKVWDVKRVDVKDLIANLYCQDGKVSPKTVPKMELEFNANGGVSDRSVQIGGGVSGDGGDDGADEDDEWEFRTAPEGKAAENVNANAKGVFQDGLDLTSRGNFASRDASSSEANGHPMFNLFIPSTNNGGMDSLSKQEDGDDNSGWEFQDARLESRYNDYIKNEVGDHSKVEDGEIVISNQASTWLIRDIGGLGSVSNSSINGLRLDEAQKDEDIDDNGGWEVHAAGTESLFRVEKSEDIIPSNDNKGANSDLFVASSGTSEGLKGCNHALDFCSNPGNTMDSNHEKDVNSVIRTTASEDDFWEFEGAVPGAGPIYQEKLDDYSNDYEALNAHGNLDSSENRPESGNAISVTVSKHEKNETSWGTKEALPLSLFGDEEMEDGYNLPSLSNFTVKGDHEMRGRATPAASITDLIASLYGQSLSNPPVIEVQEVSQGRLDSVPTGSEHEVATEEDDFDDWDFHIASVDMRGGVPNLDEHVQQFRGDELSSTLVSPETTFLKENPKLSFGGMSWEFSYVLSQANSAEQNFVSPVALEIPSTKLKLDDLVGFYNSLEGKLRADAHRHLSNGEIREDVNLKLQNKEFRELYNELHTGELVSEMPSISLSRSDTYIDASLEALHDPKFQILEAEYSLSSRLIMAKGDVKSLVELLNHAASVLHLLRLGTEEEHHGYISTWFKMISACLEELKHGAMIWRKALEHDLHVHILSKTEGKRFILSLGEIYRVVAVLGVSARFYKPWLLSSTFLSEITALLQECASTWSSSGLENALQSISDPLNFLYEGSIEALVESIKQLGDLDIRDFEDIFLASEDPLCRLSLLFPGAVPGMKLVTWNGEQYFLKLINLWVNLVSSESPELPNLSTFLQPVTGS